MWYVFTMEHYSPVKKSEIMNFTGKLMELEKIIISEVTQIRKTNATRSLLLEESTLNLQIITL